MQRASGVPHALFGREIINASGASRREGVNVCLVVIASAAKQSISPRKERMDRFVAALPCANASRLSQAMTVMVRLHLMVSYPRRRVDGFTFEVQRLI